MVVLKIDKIQALDDLLRPGEHHVRHWDEEILKELHDEGLIQIRINTKNPDFNVVTVTDKGLEFYNRVTTNWLSMNIGSWVSIQKRKQKKMIKFKLDNGEV